MIIRWSGHSPNSSLTPPPPGWCGCPPEQQGSNQLRCCVICSLGCRTGNNPARVVGLSVASLAEGNMRSYLEPETLKAVCSLWLCVTAVAGCPTNGLPNDSASGSYVLGQSGGVTICSLPVSFCRTAVFLLPSSASVFVSGQRRNLHALKRMNVLQISSDDEGVSPMFVEVGFIRKCQQGFLVLKVLQDVRQSCSFL